MAAINQTHGDCGHQSDAAPRLMGCAWPCLVDWCASARAPRALDYRRYTRHPFCKTSPLMGLIGSAPNSRWVFTRNRAHPALDAKSVSLREGRARVRCLIKQAAEADGLDRVFIEAACNASAAAPCVSPWTASAGSPWVRIALDFNRKLCWPTSARGTRTHLMSPAMRLARPVQRLLNRTSGSFHESISISLRVRCNL